MEGRCARRAVCGSRRNPMAWKRICDATEVAENSLRKFDVDGIPILLVNYGAGFRAVPPICPHMEEPLAESGIIARCILTCTKHLWAWNLQTLEMQGETEKPLKTYEIREENGAIFADIESELTYEFDSEDDADDDFFK
jgi:nitrite reductase/ring-hydroxylating ferredoxin subunit